MLAAIWYVENCKVSFYVGCVDDLLTLSTICGLNFHSSSRCHCTSSLSRCWRTIRCSCYTTICSTAYTQHWKILLVYSKFFPPKELLAKPQCSQKVHITILQLRLMSRDLRVNNVLYNVILCKQTIHALHYNSDFVLVSLSPWVFATLGFFVFFSLPAGLLI